MLAIKPPTPHQQQHPKPLHPNILPCSIHHSGPIKVSKRYWAPKTATNTPHDHGPNIQTAHFRGRKLQGRKIRLPEGYIGQILQKTDDEKELNQQKGHEALGENSEEAGEEGNMQPSAAPVRMLETKGTFDALTIWGHEHAPLGEEEDEFARGVGEWIGFAEAIHNNPAPVS
ncbi:hypothetical protein KC340_g17827 [Hortaea werneckii]|nr:hypothetical protein KC342_g18432 [Hortaea werneckii]KAI7055666.1 hypothetical protein KC339_g18348 [Hortaea werneckii]KAI7204161.1 hypothetical protein KC365_g18056 [Hortaea werneckii]KAI7288981.1 hypothetical protein KC340_g17827 [Hortaea werneckii]